MLAASEFFSDLMDRLSGDYNAASVLIVLLSQQADQIFIAISHRDLAAKLAGRIAHRTVLRSIKTLEHLGLIELKEHPNTTTRYRINVNVLRELLAQPSVPADVIPGITPLPALSRIFDGVSQLNQEGVVHEQ